MCGSLDGPLALIRWGRRLLFLTLFISCMIVLNLWHYPTTIPFLGAVISLIATGLCVVKEEEICREDDVQKCTLTDTTEH